MLRLLSAVPKLSPAPELSLLPPWIFQQVNKTTGYLNALYQPWAVLKLFDFPAGGIGSLVCFQKKQKQNTKWFLLAGSLHVSSEPVHVRESGRERVGFAGSPRSSNSTSHPPDPLTTTLVLSLHTPYWWGAFFISLGILLVFLFSSLSPSRPSACPVSSASKDPKVTALWLWVSHWITVWSCLSSASDPSCSPKIQQTPAAPSAAYVIPLE